MNFSDGRSRIFKLTEREQIWFEESCLAIENSNLGERQIRESIISLINIVLTKLDTISEITHHREQ